MLREIKQKIKKYSGLEYITELIKLSIWKNKNTEALIHLQKLSPYGSYMPMTVWSMSPTVIVHILNDILINDRRCIVEFGPGISTLFIARLFKEYQLNTKFISIESNPFWKSKMDSLIKREGLQDYVELILAPILEKDEKLFSSKWYSTEILDKHLTHVNNIDMVIIDGPPSLICETIRYHAIPYLIGKLAPSYGIFLDDSYRDGERKIIEAWEEILKVKFYDMQRYAYCKNGEYHDSIPVYEKNLV
jgi:hypothetical protein